MQTIYIAGGGPKNTAVRILTAHLERLGHRVTRDAQDPKGWDVTLRWGRSYHCNKPAINANVNQFDKYDAFYRFANRDVPIPYIFPIDDWDRQDKKFPWLARKRHHIKGKDIVVCNTRQEAGMCEDTHDFFSVFIPTKTEFRVWVLKDKAFAVSEKLYKGEGEYEGVCRNRRFGFKFENQDEQLANDKLCKPAIAAVKALNMDFGAVDILQGKDGKYYVLEVNSMPHIDSENRVSGIRLAKLVSQWAEAQR